MSLASWRTSASSCAIAPNFKGDSPRKGTILNCMVQTRDSKVDRCSPRWTYLYHTLRMSTFEKSIHSERRGHRPLYPWPPGALQLNRAPLPPASKLPTALKLTVRVEELFSNRHSYRVEHIRDSIVDRCFTQVDGFIAHTPDVNFSIQ